MNWKFVRILAVAGLLVAPAARGQINLTNLLLTNVVSREFTIHVGGLAVPEYAEVISREITVSVGGLPLDGETVSREFSVVVTLPTPPARITQLALNPSPAGDTVTLWWTNYNQWAQLDVGGYAVYVSDQAFTNVAGLKPYTFVPGETLTVTLSGLAAMRDHFFAVVPVDAAGNFDPAVNYSAAYIIAREVISRELTIEIGEPNPPAKEVIGRELSIVVTLPTPPAPITQLAVSSTPAGDTVTLWWTNYNQWAQLDVAGYEVFVGNQAFTNITGMTPCTNVPGETLTVTLRGLPVMQDHFFAVVPVDAAGNFVAGVNYAAAYIVAREVVGRELTISVGDERASRHQEVVSREISLVVPTPAVPAPVTDANGWLVAYGSLNAFSAIDLDWSAYNAWAQNDIARYRLYAVSSTQSYDDVTGLEPMAYVPGETTRWTLTGLIPLNVYHVAVVAEDVLGQFNSAVRAVSAQASVDHVGEVQNLVVQCYTNGLRFMWLPPVGADPTQNNLLAAYRVYLGANSTPLTLDRFTTSYTLTNLLPAHGYPFRIATVTNADYESPGTSLLAVTLLDPPANVTAQGLDSRVRLAWPHVAPFELFSQYAVYMAPTNFTSTRGATLVLTTRAHEVEVTNLVNGQTYYFAVAAINISQGESGLGPVTSATPNPVSGQFANLMPTNVTASALSCPGGPASFSWTVNNLGPGTTSLADGTPVAAWTDSISLSTDAVFGNADDIPVADIRRLGPLGPGDGYSTNVTVTLPRVAPGRYHVFLAADSLDEVFQNLTAALDAAMAPQLLEIRLAFAPPDQTATAGQALLVTNTPVATNLVAAGLTFGLLQGPAGMTIEAGTGIIHWTPTLAQASTTNLVSVQVTEAGTPPLGETNLFTVTVNPVSRPTINLVSAASGQAALSIAGPPGLNYVIMVSTNLYDWASVVTNTPSTLPWLWTDTNSPNAALEFYRVRLQP